MLLKSTSVFKGFTHLLVIATGLYVAFEILRSVNIVIVVFWQVSLLFGTEIEEDRANRATNNINKESRSCNLTAFCAIVARIRNCRCFVQRKKRISDKK